MAARGSESKTKIINKILETFNGAFLYDKEIRIPIVENGENIEIKCTLTCAKTNVGSTNMEMREPVNETSDASSAQNLELTQEEKNEVNDLISKLGL